MKSGTFYEGGVGYKIALNNKLAINIAAGYSFKSYTENTYNRKSIPTPPYRTEDWVLPNHDRCSLERLVMKIGLQF